MRKILIAGILIFCLNCSFACDICGCSTGNYFTGPFTHFQKKFVGVRYSFRHYYSQMADDPAEFSKDLYQTIELWGGMNIGKRWQVMGFIPYNINRQEMELHPHSEKGIGDITLLANYRILEKGMNQLWIGGGIKLPAGKFEPGFAHHPVPSANVQPGSGSVDFIFNATDVLQVGNWSFLGNVNYKINGTRKEFRFGNRLNVSAFASRSLNAGTISFIPHAGLLYEHLDGNVLQKQKVEDTGGSALLASAGADVQLGKINLGMNMQLPVAQNFSNNQTDARLRGMVHVSYIF